MTIRAFKPIKVGMGTRSGHKYNAADLSRQLSRLVANFSGLAAHMGTESPEILREALEPTFEKSKEYCPKDTGKLVNSGYLEVQHSRGGAQAAIGYAKGGSPQYAIYVHEVPRFHPEPTRWKWLQFALQEDADSIKERILNGVSRATNIRAVMSIGRGG